MQKLQNHRIYEIRISADRTVIAFYTDLERVVYLATAGCCSESWFNNFTNVSAMIGEKVRSVEVMAKTDAEGTRQDCDKVYGWKFHTDKGTAHLEMRNSSNGSYYGSIREVTMETAMNHWSPEERPTVLVEDDF